jgi:3-oxoacyl-[acyl-carrier-protein] synthase II
LNLENKDEGIQLNVFNKKMDLDSNGKVALNNSFGFGGHNVCLAFKEH